MFVCAEVQKFNNQSILAIHIYNSGDCTIYKQIFQQEFNTNVMQITETRQLADKRMSMQSIDLLVESQQMGCRIENAVN